MICGVSAKDEMRCEGREDVNATKDLRLLFLYNQPIDVHRVSDRVSRRPSASLDTFVCIAKEASRLMDCRQSGSDTSSAPYRSPQLRMWNDPGSRQQKSPSERLQRVVPIVDRASQPGPGCGDCKG